MNINSNMRAVCACGSMLNRPGRAQRTVLLCRSGVHVYGICIAGAAHELVNLLLGVLLVQMEAGAGCQAGSVCCAVASQRQ